jgi:hypothetical protein
MFELQIHYFMQILLKEKVYRTKPVKTNFGLIILVLFLLSTDSIASGFDSLYIKQFKHKFSIKANTSTRSLSFSIKSAIPDSLNRTITYVPNVNSTFGLGISYKYSSFTISFKIPKSQIENDKFGKTTHTDIQLSFYRRKFYLSAFYKKYKGFYLSNPKDIYPNWNDSLAFPIRSDMQYDAIALQGGYVFNGKKYSLRSSTNYTEQQVKSASSFLMNGDLSVINIKGDSCIIPAPQNQYYGKLKGLTSTAFLSFVVSAGYTYNFVIKKRFFINPILFTGIGTQVRSFQADSGSVSAISLFALLNFKLSLGYNGDRFFTGIVYDGTSYFMDSKEVNFTTTNSIFTLNIGVRIF